MNLSENYKKMFGEFNKTNELGRKVVSKTNQLKLTEQQRSKWDKIIESFRKQFPDKALTVKEGTVRVNGHIVEGFDKFIQRPSSEIVVMLKAKANYK